MTDTELMAWINHYRQALMYIRHITIPFTAEWRTCQKALQTTPKELPHHGNPQQLELFP